MAPSRYDWKIVDWDVKPQYNQPTNPFFRKVTVHMDEIGLGTALNRIQAFEHHSSLTTDAVFHFTGACGQSGSNVSTPIVKTPI